MILRRSSAFALAREDTVERDRSRAPFAFASPVAEPVAASSRARRFDYGPAFEGKVQPEIGDALRAEFKHANPMEVGGLTKIVVNMGVGEATRDSKAL